MVRLNRRLRRAVQSATQVRRRRARDRACGDCGVCDGETPCGWKQGMLLGKHRPDAWGWRLRAVVAADGEPSIVVEATEPDRFDWADVFVETGGRWLPVPPPEVARVVVALATRTLVMLADVNGDVRSCVQGEGVATEAVYAVWGPLARLQRWRLALLEAEVAERSLED